MTTIRRRIGVILTSGAVFGATALAGVVAAVTGAAPASALPANLTYNGNGCTNNISNQNGVAFVPIGLGSDQTDAGLANTINLNATPLITISAGGVPVSSAGTFAASHSVVVNGSSSLTNMAASGSVDAVFIQTGIGIGVISPGQVIQAQLRVLVDAGNATFDVSQPSGVTRINATQVMILGTGSATIPATGALSVTIAMPDLNYSVGATTPLTAYFYQDDSVTATTPGGNNGDVTVGGTPPAATNHFPAQGDATAQIFAPVVGVGAFIACLPGTVAPPTPPSPINGAYTQTTNGSQLVFAAAQILPAQPPVLVTPQSGTANLGGPVVIHALTGATDNVPINPASHAVVTAPSHGALTFNNTNGDITYTNDGVAGNLTDTFSYTFTSSGGTSNVATANITISQFASFCDETLQPGCKLDQVIVVPVSAFDLTMAQATALPTDALAGTFNGVSCTIPAPLVLNGQPQFACGAMSPITVINARGTDAGWTLTGQVSDFLDPALGAPGGTPADPNWSKCDTPATYNNHCIPGGNLVWDPVAAVAHGIVPGDTAQVVPGNPVLAGLNVIAPNAANAAALQDALGRVGGSALAAFGKATQTNPVVEPSPAAGLHAGANTLCGAGSGTSGGTFICGAGLTVAVPASAAAPASPGYMATLILTLA